MMSWHLCWNSELDKGSDSECEVVARKCGCSEKKFDTVKTENFQWCFPLQSELQAVICAGVTMSLPCLLSEGQSITLYAT